MERMGKRKTAAFGKDVYLLGKRKTGELIWLEAASWDCSWYWGFGYVEIYTNNEYPQRARDIQSHEHYDGLMGKQERYNFEKKTWELDNQYIHHLNEHPDMTATVLTDSESWELSDLMKTFYTLKSSAEIWHSGNSHLTSTGIDLKDKTLEDHINKDILPKIFARIYEILTPAN